MRSRPAGFRALAAALVLAAVPALAAGPGSGVIPVSLARFTAPRVTTASFATRTLAAPTVLAGTGGAAASLTWIPTSSTVASGYQVLRSATSGTGYAQVATVTPVSASATTDSPGNGTWFYILRSYLASWTSVASNEASVTVSTVTATGYKGCVSTAAVTTGAGDNNGYESNPTRACAADGSVAVDASTGTNTTNSCTSAGKDRHRFWGYSFGLPSGVSAVNGISVRADVGLGNANGTSVLCVELSWDSGTTWTTPKSVTISGTGVATYALGGAADTWGHATWTLAQLGTSTFRVRVTDVATVSNKDFRLDYLGVQVHYTP